MEIPLFGIAYGASGIACFLWGLRRSELLCPVGVVMILMGAINGYSEDWTILRRFDIDFPLLFATLVAYTALSMRLMKQIGIAKRHAAFAYSFLYVVYALSATLAFLLPEIVKANDNPPLTIYVYLLLIVIVHVPMFAFGKNRAINSHSNYLSIDRTLSLRTYLAYLWRPVLALSVPLFFCFTVQVTSRDDWRLFGSNAAMTVVLVLLLVIAGPEMEVSDQASR